MLCMIPFHKSDRRGSNPRSRPWQGRALPTTPLSHLYLLLTEAATKHIIWDDERFVNPFCEFFCIFSFSETFLFFYAFLIFFILTEIISIQQVPVLPRPPAARDAPAWRTHSRSNPAGRGRIPWTTLWSACNRSVF